MDKQVFAEYLKQPLLLNMLDIDEWHCLKTAYPFAATIQLLAHSNSSDTGDKTNSFVQDVYRNDGFQWAYFMHQKKLSPLYGDSLNEELIQDSKEGGEDILQLINEIPLTASFEINDLPRVHAATKQEQVEDDLKNVDDIVDESDEKSLMVMMSFTEWLHYYKRKQEREKEEEESKRVIKTNWQKEKLAAAVEEDVDEIPEPIFKLAMDSISNESSIVSESLALILSSQGKKDEAIAMYKKLSLRNPEKRTYFAKLIDKLNS